MIILKNKKPAMMEDKVCIITGANSGIGKIIAIEIAKKGYHTVMICRNKERGDAARKEVINLSGNLNVELMLADLSLQSEITKLSNEIKKKFPRIDILINNAATIVKDYTETCEGVETTFATNHFAYFLLTILLLQNLNAAENARIVNVASAADKYGNLDFDDLFMKKNYSQFIAYSNSKLANIIFTYDLAQRLKKKTNITVNCIHPGSTKTNISRETGGMIRLSFKLLRPFMRSPKKSAETIVWLATAPELEGLSGKYFYNHREIKSKKMSYEPEVARKLWEISKKITGLDKI